MKADPRKVATFMFQYNCFPSGLQGPEQTAKHIKPLKARGADPVYPKLESDEAAEAVEADQPAKPLS